MKQFYMLPVFILLWATAAPALARSAADADSPQLTETSPVLPLSLRDAIQRVLENNLELKVWEIDPQLAEADVMAAKASFDTTLSADLPGAFSQARSPQSSELGGAEVLVSKGLSGGMTLSRKFVSGTELSLQWSAARTESNSRYATLNPEYSSSLALGITQPLLRNFGLTVNRRDLLVARNGLSVSVEQLRARLQDVVFETTHAYWTLVFRRLDLEVKESALELARQQLSRNQAQVSIGALAPIETVQAEQAVADAEFQRIQAQQALDEASDVLKRLINLEATSPALWDLSLLPTDTPTEVTAAASYDNAVAVALEQDPLLRQARLTATIRRIDLRYYRNQRLPSLDFSGAFALSGLGGVASPDTTGSSGGLDGTWQETLARLVSGEYRSWAVGLSLSMPLVNHQARAEHRQATLKQLQAERQIALREQQVRVAVRQAIRRLNTQAEAVAAARRARALAERQLEAEQRKFEVGTTSNFQVLQVQRQLADARTQELQAIVQLAITDAGLERAQGTLLKHYAIEVKD